MVEKHESVKKRLKEEPANWGITGVAGFIESNLLEHLLRLDQSVVGLDNFSTGYENNLIVVKSLESAKQWSRFRFIKGDIRNLDECQQASKKVDYVLHEAAIGSVPLSCEDPIYTNENNITGTLNILVAARDNKVKRVIYAASCATFGDHPEISAI